MFLENVCSCIGVEHSKDKLSLKMRQFAAANNTALYCCCHRSCFCRCKLEQRDFCCSFSSFHARGGAYVCVRTIDIYATLVRQNKRRNEPWFFILPSIAQLVERWTVVGKQTGIHRSLVRIRFEGGNFLTCFLLC